MVPNTLDTNLPAYALQLIYNNLRVEDLLDDIKHHKNTAYKAMDKNDCCNMADLAIFLEELPARIEAMDTLILHRIKKTVPQTQTT